MKTRAFPPTAAHRAFREDVIKLLDKHCGGLPAVDMLALSAHLVGQMVALQDQRTITPDMAMEIVSANIEAGNAEVIASLRKTKGSA